MDYKISKLETETHISWNEEEPDAIVWTCSPKYLRKLDKLAEEHPEDYRCVREEEYANTISKEYRISKGLISFRAPRQGTAMSEERKEAARARFKEYWEQKRQEEEDLVS